MMSECGAQVYGDDKVITREWSVNFTLLIVIDGDIVSGDSRSSSSS